MNRKFAARAFAVAVLFGLVLALATIQRQFSPPVAFGTVEDGAAKIQAAGFCITADNPSGNITKGFLVSREPYH
jgi:hypothetical protein